MTNRYAHIHRHIHKYTLKHSLMCTYIFFPLKFQRISIQNKLTMAIFNIAIAFYCTLLYFHTFFFSLCLDFIRSLLGIKWNMEIRKKCIEKSIDSFFPFILLIFVNDIYHSVDKIVIIFFFTFSKTFQWYATEILNQRLQSVRYQFVDFHEINTALFVFCFRYSAGRHNINYTYHSLCIPTWTFTKIEITWSSILFIDERNNGIVIEVMNMANEMKFH